MAVQVKQLAGFRFIPFVIFVYFLSADAEWQQLDSNPRPCDDEQVFYHCATTAGPVLSTREGANSH